MNAVLGVKLPEKLCEELADAGAGLSDMVQGRWLNADGIYVHLLDLGEIVDDQREGLAFAIDKASAVTQGFGIELGAPSFGQVKGDGHAFGLSIAHHAGMLGSLALSVMGRLPAGVNGSFVEPWAPVALLAWLERSPDESSRIDLEAGLAELRQECKVKQLHLLELGADGAVTIQHTGKLPGA